MVFVTSALLRNWRHTAKLIIEMAVVSLQFHGVRNHDLLAMLAVVLAAVMLSVGVLQLVRRRWRYGAICLGAAFGPVVLGVLALDSAGRYSRNDRRGALLSAAAAMLAAVIIAPAAIFVTAADASPWKIWLAVLTAQIALCVGVFYSAVFRSLRSRRLGTLMLLRFVAVIALLLTLFKPAISVTTPAGEDESKPILPILVDRSGSMSTSDMPNMPSRYARTLQMLAGQQQRLEKHFNVKVYHFAEKTNAVDAIRNLGDLSPTGGGTKNTDIAAAINTAASNAARARTPGILLISDGIHNTGGNVTDAATEATPIYAIGVGSEEEIVAGRRNIQIASAQAPMTVIKNNVATISAEVNITGFASIPAEIRLVEEGIDQPVASRPVWTDKDSATVKFNMKWTPGDNPSARDESGGAPFADIRKLYLKIPQNPAENVHKDNSTELHVLVTRPRIRILYIEGSMRPEYKFLRRLLDSDPNVQFASLVRISGNRFWSQGSIEGKKFTQLPSTDKEFGMLDVLIIGDLDAGFLTTEQKSRIRQFVSDGGGLLMLGGHNSFGPGGYDGTPVETALPVIMGGRNQPQEKTPFVPKLTAAGQAHPIFEGMKKFFGGPDTRGKESDLPELPPLNGCVTVVDKKQGASVLAVHPGAENQNGPLIVLAVQRFGSGRSAAFTPDTTWKWRLPMQPLGAESPYRLFWSQMVRWLAHADTKSRRGASAAVLRLDRTYVRVGENVKILAAVRNKQGKPTESSNVSCTITPLDKNSDIEPRQLPLTQEGGGLFGEDFEPQQQGEYKVILTAANEAGEELGRDEITLTVAPHHTEMEQLARNTELLRKIAGQSKGSFMELAALPDLINRLIRTKAQSSGEDADKVVDYPLYNFTLLFIVFAVALTAEWLLRRNWQLR